MISSIQAIAVIMTPGGASCPTGLLPRRLFPYTNPFEQQLNANFLKFLIFFEKVTVRIKGLRVLELEFEGVVFMVLL